MAKSEEESALSTPRLARAGAVMAACSVAKVGLQLLVLPVMARLIGPAEFGLYALALPTVTFLQMLAGGGLGNSLARESETSDPVWSTAFWAVLLSCGVLAGVVVAWSFILAGIAHQPRLPAIMSTLALSLLLVAATILPGARLVRRGRLAFSAITDLSSFVIAAVVGILLAWKGLGVWSLVAQYLCGVTIVAVVLNCAAPYLPRLYFRLRELWPHLVVGGAVAGARMSDFLGRLLESAIVSRFLGSAVLGAYSLGNQVPRFVCEAVSNPTWSSLYVQSLRNDDELARRSYLGLSRLVGLALCPFAALAAAMTPTVVPLVMGPAWRAAIPVIAIVLPTYSLSVIGGLATAVLNARGRSDIGFWATTGVAAARVLATCLAPLAGLSAVAIGIGTANVLYAVGIVIVAAPLIGCSPVSVLAELRGALASAAVGGGVCLAMLHLHPAGLAWSAVSFVCAASASLIALALVEQRRLKDDFGLLVQVIAPKRAALALDQG